MKKSLEKFLEKYFNASKPLPPKVTKELLKTAKLMVAEADKLAAEQEAALAEAAAKAEAEAEAAAMKEKELEKTKYASETPQERRRRLREQKKQRKKRKKKAKRPNQSKLLSHSIAPIQRQYFLST